MTRTRFLSALLFLLLSPAFYAQRESFTVKQEKMLSLITSDNLSVRAGIMKPETLPATADISAWKEITSSECEKSLGGVAGKMKSTVYRLNTGTLELQTWVSGLNDVVAFRQVFTNTTEKTIRLLGLFPLYIPGKEGLSFGNIPDWRILEQFRQKNDMPLTEVPQAGKKISCDPFFLINNDKGTGENLFIGYQTFSLHLAEINISFTKDLTLDNITAHCDFEGVEVPAQAVRTSQWVIISAGNDAWQLIKDYTGRINEYYDPGKPKEEAPTVYCTWYYHADNYNEEIFKGDIAQFRKEHLPFDVFLIDECWDLNDWGDFEAVSSFPSGMKWAADQIRSVGYIPGIWTAPFLVDGESRLAAEHPSWLLKNSRGVMCTFNMNGRDHFIFDLTYPGVCEYLEEQFRKISHDWGYGYFKFDFMRSVFIDTDQQFHDKSATSLEAYRMGLEAIRRGTGESAYISVCGGHYGASYGIANTQRSGSDVKSQWNRTELPKYRQNILRTWMADLWHVDPDAMMVRKQEKSLSSDKRNLTTGLFTDEEAFTNTVNQFIGGNLITFTEDFASIGEDRKMLYRHVIPSVNSASRPLDLFNTEIPEIMITDIEPACKNLCGWKMISVVNWSDKVKDYEIMLNGEVTGSLGGNRFIIYDFREQKVAAYLAAGEVFSIPGVSGHQSRLYKIVPWDGTSPMFLGTDLNFSCGAEISDIMYRNGAISGSIDTGWSYPVTLAFVFPGEKTPRLIRLKSGQKTFYAAY